MRGRRIGCALLLAVAFDVEVIGDEPEVLRGLQQRRRAGRSVSLYGSCSSVDY